MGRIPRGYGKEFMDAAFEAAMAVAESLAKKPYVAKGLPREEGTVSGAVAAARRCGSKLKNHLN
jgi:hypothetical protein